MALNGQVYETLAQARDSVASVIAGGSFITAIINFMIIGWAIFLLIKAVNKIEDLADGKDELTIDTKSKPPTAEELLTEIRDELREDRN